MTRNLAQKSVSSFVLALVAVAAFLPGDLQAAGPYSFYAVTPCRVADTRFGYGGALTPLQTRLFTFRGVCSVPPDAAAVSINVTVSGATLDGHLRIFPSDQALPLVSTINWLPGEMGLANGAVVPLAALGVNTNDLAVYLGTGYASGSVQVILDVTGYYK